MIINPGLKVKMRHGPVAYDCLVKQKNPQSLSVTLAEHDQGIAPGQFAVFYRDNICLGGGIIV